MKEIIGDCNLYLGDCVDILPTLPRFDAVVTDPPYGIGESRGNNASRSRRAAHTHYTCMDWDSSPATSEQIALILGKSTWQIIFGGNYFDLPPTSCWLVWDKLNGSNDFADCELAWTNLKKSVRRIQWLWHGMRRDGNDIRYHPTQKPLEVIAWCLDHLPPVVTVCDPFMGSGTTAVACIKRGLQFTGIEREPEYFDIACKRIEQAYQQPDMFVEPQAVPEQESLL